MKVKWATWWKWLWIALALDATQAFALFWILEAIGEWSGIPGTSTLSAFIVSNIGPTILTVVTIAITQSLCWVLAWHWWDVFRLQQRKDRGS